MANGPDRSLGRDPFEDLDWSAEPETTPEGDRIITRDPFEGLDLGTEPEPEEAPAPAEPPSEPGEVPGPAEAPPEPEPTPPEPAVAPPAWTEAEEAALDIELEKVEHTGPAVELRGKGVWLLYSGDVDRAIDMAQTIGATYVLCKTGHQGMYFVESARRIHDQVRAAGLTPLAWAFAHLDNPVAEAKMAVKSIQIGYEGFIFHIGDQVSGKALAAKTLGWQLLEVDFDPGRLYYAAAPDVWQHPEIPYQAINQFCRGGFMPLCSPALGQDPRTVIDEWIYGPRLRQSAAWVDGPPVYPVLGSSAGEGTQTPLDAPEFLPWAQALEDHDPEFFSIYHAGSIGRQLWPILTAMGRPAPSPPPVTAPVEEEPAPDLPPLEAAPPPVTEPELEPTPAPEPFPFPEPEPPPAPEPEPEPTPPPRRLEPQPQPSSAVYHEVTVNDTVWGICQRYGIDKAQFWKWNGHLWDEVGMPRDTLYLQDGWRVRVG